MNFSSVKIPVKRRLDEFAARPPFQPLLFCQVNRDHVWDLYLNALPEEERQGHNCNCCKSFMRQYAGVVSVDSHGKRSTLWDFTPDDEGYVAAVRALSAYIHSLPIAGLFLTEQVKCGTDRNPDRARNIIWDHFFFEAPRTAVLKENQIGPRSADFTSSRDVMARGLREISLETIDILIDLINQGSVYRGNENLSALGHFRQLKEAYEKVDPKFREDWTWLPAKFPAVARIRNTAIGTFLVDIQEGKDIDEAEEAFGRKMDPVNYRRTSAPVTPKMVDNARARLVELGLEGSLARRILSTVDLTVDNALFVYRPVASATSVFDEIKKDQTVDPRSFSKVEEISIGDFTSKVLPTAKTIRLLLENRHLPNLVTLVGPQNPNDPTMFKWDNNFSWSYAGEVADSMVKQRVKAAGGNVQGFLRVSASWSNYDDLDLHVVEPDGRDVGFQAKTGGTGCFLDVDANGGHASTRQPVENIAWEFPPTKDGEYRVYVKQFVKRENSNTGFQVEIECNGEIFSYVQPANGSTGATFPVCKFTYSRQNGFVLNGKGMSKTLGQYVPQEKWGLTTGRFHLVKAVTLSPNYWGGHGVGNLHHMFFLEDCKTSEKTRGFYNEFLKQELMADRKVFEILGSKVVVEESLDELSGIGFSDTRREDLIVEVDGSFKRTLRIKF